MNKRVIIFIFLAISLTCYAKEKPVISLQIFYQGEKIKDLNPFGFESIFLKVFPEVAFVLEEQKKKTTVMNLYIECFSIEQVTYGKHIYNSFESKIIGKIILLSSSRILQYASDIEPGRGYDVEEKYSEIDGLKSYKRNLEKLLIKDKNLILQKL